MDVEAVSACIECRCATSVIVQDQPVAHHDVALRVGGDVQFVRDHDDGDAALVQLLENCP